jgi:outer membrane protein OmpA-like peptidoglycan-associated protein
MNITRKMATTVDDFGLSSVGAPAQSRNWVGVVIAALIVLAAALWVYNRDQTGPELTAAELATDEAADFRSDVIRYESPEKLGAFLAAPAESELPKRFRLESLHFERANATLLSASDMELNQIASALKAHPQARARLEGFTDTNGLAEVNMALSERRAQVVRSLLIERGAQPEQLEAIGRGPENPITSNASIEGRAMNRRIELVITAAP